MLAKKVNRFFRSFTNRGVDTVSGDELLMVDVFDRNYQKKVLLSYIKQPFVEGIKFHHSNYLECHTAAEVFDELGYRVDVVDLFDNTTEINYSEYEVVYGLGIPFEKAFYSLNPEAIVKIFYSTGCNPFFSYKVSALQVQNFYVSSGRLVPQSSRVSDVFWTFQYLLSDYVIALGNQFVTNTYKDTNPLLNCHPINAFYFDVYNINLEVKNFDRAKTNFLWFGSTGLLHKGLHLLIDIFSNRPDITLHTCGASKSETQFWEYYQPIVDRCSNIIDHSFIDLKSNQFNNLMDSCAYCIFPTVSEGGSPALLNVMANGGLIPIASKACGVDIDQFGFVFDELNQKEIEKQIDAALRLNIGELKEKCISVKETVRRQYHYSLYKENIAKNISKAINGRYEKNTH